jgi:uncharacterized delta-60 repeat protein
MHAMARPPRLAAPLLLALLAVLALAATAAAKPAPFSFDPSFGDHGSVDPVFPPTYLGSQFTAAKVGADGSIVANRQDDENGPGFVEVVGYLPDGRPDPSFKPEEKSERIEFVDSQGHELQAGFHYEAILKLPSGKIFVAGTKAAPREGEGAIKEVDVARYDESGALDPTFGSGGEAALPIEGGPRREEVVGLTLGAGEDVLVTLRDRPPNTNGLPGFGGGSHVVAIAGDGQLDPGYATGGIRRSPDAIDAVVALPGGGLLVAGERWGAPLTKFVDSSDIYLTRLTPAGVPDPSFGEEGGTTTVDLGTIDHAASMLLRPDGSIIVGGATTTPHLTCPGWEELYCEETPVLVGFTASGALDPDFATAGVLRFDSLTFDLAPLEAVGTVLLEEVPGGDILAGGGTWAGAFLAEIAPGGRLDPRFGEGGLVTVVRRHQSNATAAGIAVDSGGRILAYGQTNAGGLGGNSSGGPAVFRLRPDGSVDPSFAGGRGYVRLPGRQVGIAVDSRGRALVLAGKYTANTLTRVTASGELDPSFGSGGIASLAGHASIFFKGRQRGLGFFPRTVSPLPGGGALVMGAASGGGALSLWRIEVMRLTDRGRLDRSFGHGGRVILSVGQAGESNARAMTVLPDGRILLGGSIRGGHAPHQRQTAALIRLRPDGSLDRTFGKGGVVTIDGPGKSLITALAVGPKGEVVTGGRRIRGKRWTGLLARFSPNGRLDRAFVDRAAGTFRGAAKDATSPSQISVAGGGILTVHAYWPQALVYSVDGRFDRRIAFGKRHHPSTWVEGAARQGNGIVVASKTGGHPTFTLRRLLLR